jgi:PAS domain S-box-containing protein
MPGRTEFDTCLGDISRCIAQLHTRAAEEVPTRARQYVEDLLREVQRAVDLLQEVRSSRSIPLERREALREGFGGADQPQAVLQWTESYFRALVERAHETIMVVGADGIIQFASPSHLDVLGYRPEERVGRSTFELLHPNDAPAARELVSKLLNGEGYAEAELRVRHADGSYRVVHTRATNLLHVAPVRGVVIRAVCLSLRSTLLGM